MIEDEAFLRTIAADPADATARLVYADWLDERSDPRGAYLRLDVHFSSLPPGHPDAPGVRRQMIEMRPELPASWLAALGDFHATPDDHRDWDRARIEAAAALLGRPVKHVDGWGYDISIDAGTVCPLTGAIAFLECRQKEVNSVVDIEFQLRLRDPDGGSTSWIPETYNPYFGCDAGFLEWFGDAVVMIYREKHRTYIARVGIDQRPDFKEISDQWVLDGRHAAHWKYQESTIRRMGVPSLDELPPLTPEEAAAWGVLPDKFW